jgi:UDP-N-acetylglucosamine/UDP-N-acetylgalactosamine 4-epimerase
MASISQSDPIANPILSGLKDKQCTWLVTGAAGFIGSNLCFFLLQNNQRVVGFDNFATGLERNIKEIRASQFAANFEFVHGDIRNLESCVRACLNVDFVLHQAALGSVPRSIADPLSSHAVNVDGFINMLKAAVDSKVKRFVYASSSSVYGDSPELPKVEARTGRVLSPYAATKAINELYASVFQRTYGLSCVGLRYFNVFGPRQDPNGQYAAVIPRWTAALLDKQTITVNGDGTTSRDFCYIENVVQANVASALSPNLPNEHVALNVAFGEQASLLDLIGHLGKLLNVTPKIEHGPFRNGDVLHSLANTDLARNLISYTPKHSFIEGLKIAVPWYVANHAQLSSHTG